METVNKQAPNVAAKAEIGGPVAIRMIETEPMKFTVTDDATVMVTNVSANIEAGVFAQVAARLDLSHNQIAFMLMFLAMNRGVIVGGHMSVLALASCNVRVEMLGQGDVQVTHGVVGNG